MSAHLISDPEPPTPAIFPAAPGWLSLSAALTREVPAIAGRDDLLVTIAPGAGHGSPACFLPSTASIEVDGAHLTVDPATVTPHVMSDRVRYSTMWGLLTHECAHARHSRWDPPPGTPPAVVEAAFLLEEPRIERAQIRRRPDDRHWLRFSSMNLILAETLANDPACAPAMTPGEAARTAALLLGRTSAGILTRTETAPVATVVKAVLGDKLAELREVWRKALTVADDDADTMLELGRKWCEIVDSCDAQESGDPSSASSGPEDPSAPPTPSRLAKAIVAALDRVAKAVAGEQAPVDPAEVAAAGKAAEGEAVAEAADAAYRVFVLGDERTGRTETAGTRSPTSAERIAARTLGRSLSTAGIRERVVTKTSSPVPPGRLRMRGAMAVDAQRAAGAMPTAEPFTRTTRTPVPAPPMRLGIACDVSASMSRVTESVASAAWILANAASHATVPVETATVIFGSHVRPITRPGAVPREVTRFKANDGYEAVDRAIDALDGALGLSRPGAARLLVIISDGHFRPGPLERAQQRVDRLRASRCAVLWLSFDDSDIPLDGAQVHQLAHPAATAKTIGRAATAALRAAR
ncbi:hypothetical protein ABZ470_39740 [Streptosporangium sp. NPDC020072]|uniref:hypothetical protein n=1 Tax=Streptosporangium sp. NPDC020072 TaxID=3154788 RepID=UPI00342A40C7